MNKSIVFIVFFYSLILFASSSLNDNFGCSIGSCKDGYGEYVFENRDKYIGEFSNGSMDGYGEYFVYNGEYYKGEFKNHKFNGYGKYTFPSGQYFEGYYIDGKRNGIGLLFYANGNMHIGEFKNGKRHGFGIIIHRRGDIQSWDFYKGELFMKLPLESTMLHIYNTCDKVEILEKLEPYKTLDFEKKYYTQDTIVTCNQEYGLGSNIYNDCPNGMQCHNGLCVENQNPAIESKVQIKELELGCMDERACNFSKSAQKDDGSCWYQIKGCGCDKGKNAFVDDCGICMGDNSICRDCSGVINGTAYLDRCGNCDNIVDNDCSKDCKGIWGGDAYVDQCGNCDNIMENDCIEDCNGVWGGNAIIDECGICNGNGKTQCKSGNYVCDILECKDSGCDLPNNTIKLLDGEILYNSDFEIHGFQIVIEDAYITQAYSGDAYNNNFTTNFGGRSLMSMSYSQGVIKSGCGTLIKLIFDDISAGITSASFYDSSGMPHSLKIIK